MAYIILKILKSVQNIITGASPYFTITIVINIFNATTLSSGNEVINTNSNIPY